jgi:hypothetical protein
MYVERNERIVRKLQGIPRAACGAIASIFAGALLMFTGLMFFVVPFALSFCAFSAFFVLTGIGQ